MWSSSLPARLPLDLTRSLQGLNPNFSPCLFRAGGYFCPAAYNAPEHNRKGASNMELKVFKDTIASYGGRWETRLELPVETEILIPRLPARRIQDRQVPDHARRAAEPCVRRALAERGLSALHRLLPERGPARAFCAPSRNLPLKNWSSCPPGSTPTARPRSGASRNTATAAPSVSTASTCAVRTSLRRSSRAAGV